MTRETRPTGGGTGTVVEKYCGDCDGRGVQKRSKQLTISIPPGVEDGNRLRVRGEGDAGPKGGPSGDLYVSLSIKADPRFRREGMDIYTEMSVSYLDAILGSTLRVPTVDATVDLKMPAGTQPASSVGRTASLGGGAQRYVTPVRVHSFSRSPVTPAPMSLLSSPRCCTRLHAALSLCTSRSHASLSSLSPSSSNRRLKCRSALFSQRALVVTRRRLPGIAFSAVLLSCPSVS